MRLHIRVAGVSKQQEAVMKRENLGGMLIKMGRIDALQLKSALAHQQQWGTPLGKVLVEHRFCTWSDVLEALAKQTGHQAIELDKMELEPALAELVPSRIARQFGVVPLRLDGAKGEILLVAIRAPGGLDALDAIRSASGKRVRAFLAADDAIERAQARLYDGVELSTSERHVAPLNEQSFDLDATATREVLIYGWDKEASKRLAVLLAESGFRARIATQADVLLSHSDEVLLAPLPVMEALTVRGIEVSARLLAAGKRPETDAARAFWLGAKAFIAAPLEPSRLISAIRRLFDAVPAAGPAGAAFAT